MLYFLHFAISHFFNVCTPGPGFLLIVENSVIYGRKTGIKTLIILHLAYTVQMITAFLIINFSLSENNELLEIINLLGAIFLLYFAFKIMFSDKILNIEKVKSSINQNIPFKKLFKPTFIYGLLNIKALSSYFIFIGAVAPCDQRIHYAVWIISTSCIYNYLIIRVMTTSKIREYYLKYNHIIDYLSGLLLIVMAILIFSKLDALHLFNFFKVKTFFIF